MIAEVTIDDKELRAHLAGIVKRKDQITARDKAIVGILSSVVFKDIMEHFDREEGPEGGWPGWSPSYTKFMDSIGRGNNKLLQFTGRLRGSFQPTNVRTSSEGVLWFNNAQTESGFPYAAAHNEGGGKLPQREFMWVSDSALEDMSEQLLRFLES